VEKTKTSAKQVMISFSTLPNYTPLLRTHKTVTGGALIIISGTIFYEFTLPCYGNFEAIEVSSTSHKNLKTWFVI